MDDYRAEAKRRWRESQRAAGGVAEGAGGGAAGSGSAAGDVGRGSEGATSPKSSAGGGASGSSSRSLGADQRGASSPKTAGADQRGASSPKTAGIGGGAAQEGDLLGAFWARWAALSGEQQIQALALCGLAFAVLVMGTRSVPLLATVALVCYLSTQLPTTASFEPFFRQWFTKEYYPTVSQKLQREFQERAERERGLFESLALKFQGWVVGQTEKLSALAMYEFVVKYSLPPTYGNWYFLRTATVNVGSRRQPAYLTFWGIHGSWMLAPYITVDVENTSILEELQKGATATQ